MPRSYHPSDIDSGRLSVGDRVQIKRWDFVDEMGQVVKGSQAFVHVNYDGAPCGLKLTDGKLSIKANKKGLTLHVVPSERDREGLDNIEMALLTRIFSLGDEKKKFGGKIKERKSVVQLKEEHSVGFVRTGNEMKDESGMPTGRFFPDSLSVDAELVKVGGERMLPANTKILDESGNNVEWSQVVGSVPFKKLVVHLDRITESKTNFYFKAKLTKCVISTPPQFVDSDDEEVDVASDRKNDDALDMTVVPAERADAGSGVSKKRPRPETTAEDATDQMDRAENTPQRDSKKSKVDAGENEISASQAPVPLESSA